MTLSKAILGMAARAYPQISELLNSGRYKLTKKQRLRNKRKKRLLPREAVVVEKMQAASNFKAMGRLVFLILVQLIMGRRLLTNSSEKKIGPLRGKQQIWWKKLQK